jgi:hypothetical protein
LRMRSSFRSNRGYEAHLLLRLTALALISLTFVSSGISKSSPSPALPIKELRFELGTLSQPLRLRGTEAKQQLVLTAVAEGGPVRDATREVRYQISPANIARIDTNGLVVPLADGKATITAKAASGISATLPVVVEHFKSDLPINFPNQIVPIFTKTGCNGGGCHGKSSGQNGFRLSLLGFEPSEDYEHLVKEARGRRLFPAAPDRSLLLLKATATVPHGGGKRLSTGSDDYNLLLRWVAQGMPYGSTNDPSVASIEVVPSMRTMSQNSEQQIVVLAKYTDGSMQDVTRSALFEANEKELAKTTDGGRVQVLDNPGDVAVMVRYQARSAVFRATVPLGAPVATLPEPNNVIDELVFKKLKTVGMPPSPLCDDATFLRRTAIDIAGRLPNAAEAKQFQSDTNLDKRARWIDSLLSSSDYADNFANKWTALLRNKRAEPAHKRGTFAFHSWIRDSFAENKPYDQFVRDILAASGDIEHNPPVAWYRQVNNMTAQLEDTAQLFLGQRLQCAQCHHHPFEKWSQQDYYSFGAFFSTVAKKPGFAPGEEVVYHKRGNASATNKKTKLAVKPAGLGAAPPSLTPDDDPRQALADWMTSKENRFFARALVNRYWKHFFGRGLVDPEDDMRDTNPPTNPELLDSLAKHFVESGYDLKQLVRTISGSKTYQLSAIPNEHNGSDRNYFARFYPRRLTAEVLLDSVNQVIKAENKFEGLPVGMRAVQLPDNGYNASSYFLTVFGRPEGSTSCECERSQGASLAQSLHLLNSKELQEKIASDKGYAAALASDTSDSDQKKIADLYMTAFARQPESKELEAAIGHIEKKAAGKSDKEQLAARRQAYEDIIWALINTKEFLFNH